MADITKITDELKLNATFADSDTRVITLKNPRMGLTREEVDEVEEYILQNNLLIGDRQGAGFVAFGKVETRRQYVKYLEIRTAEMIRNGG